MHYTNESKNSRTEGSVRNFPENTANLLVVKNKTYGIQDKKHTGILLVVKNGTYGI